ncbi:transcription elongation factor GreA [Kineosporia sp. J2-2]|uniref:Transcription elongation factor GreA n=1 Tax=Kineosporia corallincola TaxID=2835133 RepID=A0ABS5THC1_9ACTN|nr:transcription elongation factor GreA [Kineosporia corallincola]MBT0770493.1 transcription elongation factor GreA [Kineosporia corallincola]
MSETGAAVAWLTQDAYDRLKNELEYLSGEGRVEIAKTIEAARAEGDLKENGGYHAAKDQQGKMEARIRQLRQLLETAKVGETTASDGTVASGSVVTIDLAGEEMVFLLGSREVAGDTDLDVYSEKSPLGSAIVGHKVGDTTSYTAPNGREITVKILEAKPFTG